MQNFSVEDLLEQMEEMQNEIEQKDYLIKDKDTQLSQLKETDGEKECEIRRLNAFIRNLNKEHENALGKLKKDLNKLEQSLEEEKSRRQSLSENYWRKNNQYTDLIQEHDSLQRRYNQNISCAEYRTKSAESKMAQTKEDLDAASDELFQFRTGSLFLLGVSVPCLLVPGGSFLRDCSRLGSQTASAAYTVFLWIVNTIRRLSGPAMGWNLFAGYILRVLMALVPIALFTAVVYFTAQIIVWYFGIAANRVPSFLFLLTSTLCTASWHAWSADTNSPAINTALVLIIAQPVFYLLRFLLSPVVEWLLHWIRE